MSRKQIARIVMVVLALSLGYNNIQAQTDQALQITIGNVSKNWITVERVKRDQSTRTFSEVQIEGGTMIGRAISAP